MEVLKTETINMTALSCNLISRLPPNSVLSCMKQNGVNQSTVVSFPVLLVTGRWAGSENILPSHVSLLFLATVMADPSTAAQFQPPPPPTLPSILPSGAKKCAIPECPNACYMDPSGTVHECCGYTHAMEHQRRQALLQRTLI